MEESTQNTYPVIEIGKPPKNKIDKVLQALRLKPSYHRFELRPILIGNRWRISEKVLSLPESISIDRIDKSVFNLYNEHIDSLIYIIAVGMVNEKDEPSKRLLARIKRDFSTEDLFNAMKLVMSQINLASFTSCLVLILGQNILKVPTTDDKSNQDKT